MTKLNATNPRKLASQERSKITVEAILDATARVLVREGYARTSTNRIATVAGVSIGSLYQYFPNKESLVAALVARHNRKILSLLENTMQECTSEDLNSTMRELVRAMIAAYRVDPELHRILMEEVPRIGKLAEVEAIRKDMLHLVRYYLEQCKDNVEVRDLDMAAFICATTVEALTHAIVLNDCSQVLSDEATIVEHITRMIAGYLGTTHSSSVVA
ncbi:TetR/AcrR family transcriptional regulator [Bacillus subtilis]|uniref:TetR/AcrR family transcriptional regulator n=1 Tax=Pseudochrobactrum asaccharolyticum TaxID=354351 RepID=UPI001F1CEE17|nr:TetR/AcrR family transcriptional regulator [Pseudochrobactrum asaccharolyticum]MCF7672842.1 TetR/AcrR family transcriptional regulator [Bacillus subtilis]